MQTDILGEPYEARIIELGEDDEGLVVATLVSRRSPTPAAKAVLYLHGYNDYFFQSHIADFFVERGFDFYALDLRKYGRSLLPHQTPNFVRSMAEYFPEIDESVRIINAEGSYESVVMMAHSTGGLVGSLWAHSRPGKVDGLLLNSPFFDINAAWLVRRPMAATVLAMSGAMPYQVLPMKIPSLYGKSLHKDFKGEWAFNVDWKPVDSFPVRMGWLQAVRRGQQRLRAGLNIGVPIFVAHSGASYRKFAWTDAAHDADTVLNVDHIARWSLSLGDHLTIVRIEGGKHDLTLSRKTARQHFFDETDRWMNAYL